MKYYCYVSQLKYKIIFFLWIINEEKYFLFHVSIKAVRKKHEIKNFSIVQSIEFYSFDVKAIVTKKVACNILWKHSQKKKNVIIETFSCDIDDHKFFKMDPIPRLYQQHFWITWTKGRRKTKGTYNFPDLTRLKLPKFSQT